MKHWHDDEGNRKFSAKINKEGNIDVDVARDGDTKIIRNGKYLWDVFLFCLTEKEAREIYKVLGETLDKLEK